MKIYSWNINGIRSAVSKGFYSWLSKGDADIVGVQEVRAFSHQIPPLPDTASYSTHFFPAIRPGYSGVGLYSKTRPDSVVTTIGAEDFDKEGRVQMASFGKLLVVNVYVPNGTGPNRDLSRIPFKLDFSRRLFDVLDDRMKAGDLILVLGDFNTAHEEIDIARPRENEKNSGFRPEEREEFGRWIAAGWVDAFRYFEKSGGHYTWWSNRFGVREKNIGWRIDYTLASPALMPLIRNAEIHAHVMGSDHCPISVEIDDSKI